MGTAFTLERIQACAAAGNRNHLCRCIAKFIDEIRGVYQNPENKVNFIKVVLKNGTTFCFNREWRYVTYDAKHREYIIH